MTGNPDITHFWCNSGWVTIADHSTATNTWERILIIGAHHSKAPTNSVLLTDNRVCSQRAGFGLRNHGWNVGWVAVDFCIFVLVSSRLEFPSCDVLFRAPEDGRNYLVATVDRRLRGALF